MRTSLEEIGYISVSVSTDWSITDNSTTDIYFNLYPIILTDFERCLLSVTPLRVFQSLFENIASVSTFDMHRRTLLNDFDALVESTRISGPSIISDNITPVNLFRIIFDEYFNANLPLLENAYYYPEQAVMIYDLVDVTPFIDRRQNCVLR